VPPHAWNVDFPHLMRRAQAAKYQRGRVALRDKVLSNIDALGRFAGIPIVTETVALNRTKQPVRNRMESALGVDKDAWLPAFAPRKFRKSTKASPDVPARDGESTLARWPFT
jgi:glycerol-3-phosphate dehydrogenase subunit C